MLCFGHSEQVDGMGKCSTWVQPVNDGRSFGDSGEWSQGMGRDGRLPGHLGAGAFFFQEGDFHVCVKQRWAIVRMDLRLGSWLSVRLLRSCTYYDLHIFTDENVWHVLLSPRWSFSLAS